MSVLSFPISTITWTNVQRWELFRCAIGIVKVASHKLKKVPRNMKISLETTHQKKWVLNCYVISFLIWKWILNNVITDEEKNGGNRNSVIQVDVENSMRGLGLLKSKDGLETLTITWHIENKRDNVPSSWPAFVNGYLNGNLEA